MSHHKDQPAKQTTCRGVYVRQHLSFAVVGKACRAMPRSEPSRGNPAARDRREACGNVSMMGAGLRPSGKPLDWPPYPKMHARRTSIPTLEDASITIRVVKTRGGPHPWDQSVGSLMTGRATAGVQRAGDGHRLSRGTAGTRFWMPREKHKRRTPQGESTEAEIWVGSANSSDESPVMGLERRGRVRWS